MASNNIIKKIDKLINEKIINENLENIVSDAFGRYSKYIIQERALPDVRDGLKPVQRRILYAMYKLGMFSDKAYKKSARIAGEVMGKYHPHGDSSIYEAMVRMSQEWKLKELLIDMHGNNGSIDGDPAAAMRYTEARLSEISELLLQDIDKETIMFVPNFDDEEIEPVVLPSKIPNLLVNGSSGISSGYATEIPPHNLSEVIHAVIFRIKNPNSNLEDIQEIVKGPDFPTGGIIQGKTGIDKAYNSGRGKIIIKSKCDIVSSDKKHFIIITELPYDVNKANLVKKIELIRRKKKIDGILEVRDESDREGLRVCIDIKKQYNPELILNYLLKETELQKSFNFNMVAINNKRPVLMGILEIIDAYIIHQKEVITNRSNYILKKSEKRLHILDGLMKMLSIIDEIIKVIRESKNKKNARENLIKQFDFTELQSEAIVTLQLYKLTSTDITELTKEFNDLNKLISKLKKILSNEKELLKVIINELDKIEKKYGSIRKSEIVDLIENIKLQEEDFVKEEDCIVSFTNDLYIKRTSMRSYSEIEKCGTKESDYLTYSKLSNTKNYTLLFTNKGSYIFLPNFKIPDVKWKSVGTHINNLVQLEKEEKIVSIINVDDFKDGSTLLISTKNGSVKQCNISDFEVQRYSKSIRAIKLKEDDLVVCVDKSKKYLNEILSFTKKGKAIKYNSNEVSIVGTNAQGVRSIKLDEKDELVSSLYVNKHNSIIVYTNKNKIMKFNVSKIMSSLRGRKGELIFKVIKSNPIEAKIINRINNSQIKDNVSVKIFTTENIEDKKLNDIISSRNTNGYNVKFEGSICLIDIEDKEEIKIIEKSNNSDKLVTEIKLF